jgi:S-DNA-T family DNA segregation ATPase FtsK/SpoIIIE
MTISALHWDSVVFLDEKFQTGGLIGRVLAKFVDDRFSALGSHTLLIGLLLIALLISTPFTLKAVIEKISALWSSATLWLLGDADAEIGEAEVEHSDLPPVRAKRKEKISSSPVQAEMFVKKRGEFVPPSPVHVDPGQYLLPDLMILDTYETETDKPDWKRLEQNGVILEEKLADFGVQGEVVGINPGPVITMFEYAPAPGIKISRIVNLADDLSMALKAESVRVVAPIPGKAAVGIEIPNLKREVVSLKAVLESEIFSLAPAPLTVALGKDITGQAFVTNLGKMPHLLIAGATGTGKSVCINTLLSSLLFRNTPEELRLLLIDPKRIELSSFEGIPHLIHPVVTDAKMATRALRWAVEEMELRYKMLADKNVRNIEAYNRLLAREKPRKAKEVEKESANGDSNDSDLQHYHLPYVVIIIDELADLMMVASREVEESITRLAQMARAAGIHLLLATQRPSVDVLTGTIKANIPTRISFQVSSKIDSRTILDGSGAEALLGAGDMLFLPPGTAKLQRLHGAFVSDAEIARLAEHWKVQKLIDDPLKGKVDLREESTPGDVAEEELDEKYDDAVQIVLETRQASISMLQRRLRVGYNRAARMIEVMEQQGIVSPSDGIKPREVLGRRLS